MGTIAEKLTYLNNTKEKIRDSINLTGANIGTSDTFRSYASKLKKGYIDIINNGIDTLYNNFPKVSGIGSNLSLTPTYEAPMKLNEIQGDTLQDGTPTPNTPVEIQSVTGLQNVTISNADNTQSNTYEVNLGKNIWSVGNKNVGWATNYVDVKNILNTLSEGTYSIKLNFKVTEIVKERTDNQYGFSFYNSNGNIGNKKNTNSNINVDDIFTCVYTFTISKSQVGNFTQAYFYGFGNGTDNVTARSLMYDCQLEKGSQATSYSPYFTPIELNKIGDYQDSIKKSTGKNIITTYNYASSGYINYNYDNSKIGKTMTYSFIPNFSTTNASLYIRANTSISSYKVGTISTITSGTKVSVTFTLTDEQYDTIKNTNGGYIQVYKSGVSMDENSISNPMLEINSQSTSYEPYGKVWYVEKQIGKVVLDSNLSSVGSTNFSNVYQIYANVMNISYLIGGFCDNFKFNDDSRITDNNNANIYLSDNQCALRLGNESARDRFYVKSTNFASANELKAYFNTNPTTLYYVLETPEYTEITNTELIEDLETLYTAKSKEGTTNISITSEDLEMILNVSALKGEV